MNKKLFKFSLVLCASILMAISCTKKDETPTTPQLPSIGKLTTSQSGILALPLTDVTGTEKSAEIQVSGFSDSFKKAATSKTDIKYTIKAMKVNSISSTQAMQEEDPVKKLQDTIKLETFNVEIQSTFDKIKIVGAGEKSKANAQAIATAIGDKKTAAITVTVEATPAGNTEGKYTSSTFEVRLGIQVASKEE